MSDLFRLRVKEQNVEQIIGRQNGELLWIWKCWQPFQNLSKRKDPCPSECIHCFTYCFNYDTFSHRCHCPLCAEIKSLLIEESSQPLFFVIVKPLRLSQFDFLKKFSEVNALIT